MWYSFLAQRSAIFVTFCTQMAQIAGTYRTAALQALYTLSIFYFRLPPQKISVKVRKSVPHFSSYSSAGRAAPF